MYKKIFSLFFFVFLGSVLFAQEPEHDHEHEHEHHHKHEIGASVGPIYFVNEEELSVAAHFHYVYNFEHSKFGLGAGYEQVFDEHKHRFIGAEFSYRPVHRLTLSLSPGIAFEGAEDINRDFAVHFETSYEFEMGIFHIGPVAEVAWHVNDYHVSLGVHFGFGF